MKAPIENILWSELTNFRETLSQQDIRRHLDAEINWPYFMSKVLREKTAHRNYKALEELRLFQDLPDEVQTILQGEYLLATRPSTQLSQDRHSQGYASRGKPAGRRKKISGCGPPSV